ncbi:hypothetical protein AB8B21_05935 [Tardiphaga sp. 866_E4_N2_1]|uniref:hypothetical protein n=1 Tax=unclassified Tardiphaga TaxID=2631404 RepID=UPI003F1F75F4
MEVINRCRDITADKIAEIEEFDRRNGRRKEEIANRAEYREQSETFGNRKERRRQAALDRQNKECV